MNEVPSSPWKRAFILAGSEEDKASSMVMSANFSSIKERKCPRCGSPMEDVLISFGKKSVMYCKKDRVVIPHPVS